jgi:hypothetical protein
MVMIPCTDFYEDETEFVPVRIKRTNPDSIRDRWANFFYSMDLSPLQDDDALGNQYGAWSLGDIPATHCAQYIDDRGNDLIVVAIIDRVYILDWTRNADEWLHNSWAPIYQMCVIGPLPSSKDDAPKGYALDILKRFRELQFSNRDGPNSGINSKWRVSVAEWDVEEGYKITVRQATKRMRIPVAKKGRSFMVRLEHAADEPIRIEHFQAKWDMLGPRFKNSKRTQ